MPIMTRIKAKRYRTNEEFAGTHWFFTSHAGYWSFNPEEESETTLKITSGIYPSRMKAYDALRQKATKLA